jgi:hypothetical protein
MAERRRIVPDEFSVLVQVFRDCVPGVVIAVASRKNYNADLHASANGYWLSPSGSGSSSFFPAGATLFDGGLTIAFLQSRKDDGRDELLFAMVVELDDDVIVVTREHRTEPEFAVLDLGALRKCRFISHGGVFVRSSIGYCNSST